MLPCARHSPGSICQKIKRVGKLQLLLLYVDQQQKQDVEPVAQLLPAICSQLHARKLSEAAGAVRAATRRHMLVCSAHTCSARPSQAAASAGRGSDALRWGSHGSLPTTNVWIIVRQSSCAPVLRLGTCCCSCTSSCARRGSSRRLAQAARSQMVSCVWLHGTGSIVCSKYRAGARLATMTFWSAIHRM